MKIRKSHTLVTDVRELFDTLDQCFNATAFEFIMTQIEQSAESILDRDCRNYPITLLHLFQLSLILNFLHLQSIAFRRITILTNAKWTFSATISRASKNCFNWTHV